MPDKTDKMTRPENDNMGQNFRGVMEGFDEDLPIRVWDNIGAVLDKDKNRRRALLLWRVAASVALVISFSAGYYLASKNKVPVEMQRLASREMPVSDVNRTGTFDSKDGNKKTPTINKNAFNSPKHVVAEVHATTPDRPGNMYQPQTLPADTTAGLALTSETIHDSDALSAPVAVLENSPLAIDTSTTNKSVPDLQRDFTNSIEKQNGITDNKTLPPLIPPAPEKKKQEPSTVEGGWTLAQQFAPVGYMGSLMQKDLAAEQANSFAASISKEDEALDNKSFVVVYATGLSARYSTGGRWDFVPGVFYTAKQFSNGLQYRQVEVPLTLSYNVLRKKVRWSLDGGFSAGILPRSNSKGLTLAALAGTTVGIALSPRIALNVQPVLKYHFATPAQALFRNYPVSVAVFTGLSYRLK